MRFAHPLAILMGMIGLNASAAAEAALSDHQLLTIADRQISGAAARWNISAPIIHRDSGPVVSLPTEGVRISPAGLRELLVGTPDADADWLLGWVMAHEVWHQVQYRNGFDLLRADEPTARARECEADVMASRAMIEDDLRGASAENDAAELKLASRLETLVAAAQRLEAGFNGVLTHPAPDQRLTAIRSGSARAVYERLVQSASSDPQRSLVLHRLARIHDIQEGEAATSWAARLCGLILHVGNGVPFLAMDQPNLQWSTKADAPFVDFSIPYRNTGTQPLHVNVVIRSASVLRTARQQEAGWTFADASRHEFDLLPGGSYRLNGRLEWYATDERMPKLVYPHQNGSLYDAVVVPTSADPQTSGPSAPITLGLTPELETLKSTLQAILTDAPNQFRAVAPVCPDDRSSESCTLPIAIPGVTSSEVNRSPDGSSYVDLEIYRGSSEVAAVAAYQAFRARLQRIYPGIAESTRDRPDSVSFTIQPSARATLMLSRRKRDNGDWIVSIWIEPKLY